MAATDAIRLKADVPLLANDYGQVLSVDELLASSIAKAKAVVSLRARNPELDAAINTLKFGRLREIVKRACIRDESVERTLAELLLVSEEDVTVVHSEGESNDGEEGEEEEEREDVSSETMPKMKVSEGRLNKKRKADDELPILPSTAGKLAPVEAKNEPRRKRMRSRYVTCYQCEQEFDVTANKKGACIYHPGDLYVNDGDGLWEDHDENCHGRIDLDLKDEYPEGFIWDCCSTDNTNVGCEQSWHRGYGDVAFEDFKS